MIKIGCDLVLNSRLEKQLGNERFLKKVFHPSELKQAGKLAGIFALKEATMKALGRKLNWLSIEVSAKDGRKPKIILANSIKPKNFRTIDGTLSHDGDYTIAFVVIE